MPISNWKLKSWPQVDYELYHQRVVKFEVWGDETYAAEVIHHQPSATARQDVVRGEMGDYRGMDCDIDTNADTLRGL